MRHPRDNAFVLQLSLKELKESSLASSVTSCKSQLPLGIYSYADTVKKKRIAAVVSELKISYVY